MIQLSTISPQRSYSREFCFQEEKQKLGQRQISKQIKPPRPKSPTAERNCGMIYGKSRDKDIIDFRAKQFPKASTHSSLKHNEHEKFTIGLTMFM